MSSFPFSEKSTLVDGARRAGYSTTEVNIEQLFKQTKFPFSSEDIKQFQKVLPDLIKKVEEDGKVSYHYLARLAQEGKICNQKAGDPYRDKFGSIVQQQAQVLNS